MAGRVRGLLERLLVRQRAEQHNGVPDAELLRRFSRDRDEAAFELLVWRHGAMVLGLCRRAVRDEQLAEDAFQAVFLVLARKAGAVRGNLGGWLFKVARRVSLRAAARQPVTLPAIETTTEHPDSAERNELSALLDAEIARLPERLRRPVVLCYLGGQSTEDAARELGCPRGTVLSRLAAARKRLSDRLTRRGCALPATLTATALSGRLVSNATAAATAFRSGVFTASTATILAKGVLQTMSRTTLLTALGVVALAASLVGGVGWVASGPKPSVVIAADIPADPPKPAPDAPKPAPDVPKVARPDVSDFERRQFEENRRRLEQLAESIRTEIEAHEKNVDLLVKANGDDAARAVLQKRLTDLETETNLLSNELLRLETELGVLKKRHDDKYWAPDAAAVAAAADNDPGVKNLTVVRDLARGRLAAMLGDTNGEDTQPVQAQRARVDTAEKALDDQRKKALEAAAESVRAAEKGRLKRRITELEESVTIKKEISEKLKSERDAVAKAAKINAGIALDIQRMRDAIQPQRETLAKVQGHLMSARLRAQGVTLPEAGSSDAKLDLILKELAALRREVQELKAKR